MKQHRFDSLEEALGSVRRAVEPTRDLWPDIARRLDVRNQPSTGAPTDLDAVRAARSARRWQGPLALAASLGVVGLVAALYWVVVQQRAAPGLMARATHAAAAGHALVNFGPPLSADYVAASAELERTCNERLKLLAPATRTRVQADLETIRRANQDLRAALAQDPASPLLLQLLQSTWQREIDLYTDVAQSTEPLLTRRTKL